MHDVLFLKGSLRYFNIFVYKIFVGLESSMFLAHFQDVMFKCIFLNIFRASRKEEIAFQALFLPCHCEQGTKHPHHREILPFYRSSGA